MTSKAWQCINQPGGGPLEEEFHSRVLRPPEQEPLTIHFLCALFLKSQGLRLEDWPWGYKLVLHNGLCKV